MPQAPYNAPMHQKSNTLKIVLIVGAVILGILVIGCGLLAALLLPAIAAARQAAQRQMASNNLKQIGLAFHNHASAYKALPALHGINHENKPTGNWRVVISPFVERTDVFSRFNFHKPWDAPESIRSEYHAGLVSLATACRRCHVKHSASPLECATWH